MQAIALLSIRRLLSNLLFLFLKSHQDLFLKETVITEKTTGFFKCYIKTYQYINQRYQELFGK